jgi:hypothetical protein
MIIELVVKVEFDMNVEVDVKIEHDEACTCLATHRGHLE